MVVLVSDEKKSKKYIRKNSQTGIGLKIEFLNLMIEDWVQT